MKARITRHGEWIFTARLPPACWKTALRTTAFAAERNLKRVGRKPLRRAGLRVTREPAGELAEARHCAARTRVNQRLCGLQFPKTAARGLMTPFSATLSLRIRNWRTLFCYGPTVALLIT